MNARRDGQPVDTDLIQHKVIRRLGLDITLLKDRSREAFRNTVREAIEFLTIGLVMRLTVTVYPVDRNQFIVEVGAGPEPQHGSAQDLSRCRTPDRCVDVSTHSRTAGCSIRNHSPGRLDHGWRS